MKNMLVILSILLLSTKLSAQCLDVYGHNTECPTIDDSLVIYNNSLKVYSYFENNKDYKKISSVRLNTKLDVTKCFYRLDSALDEFKLLWQQRERRLAGEPNNDVLMPRGGENIEIEVYYQRVDDYRFYQREFENGILNTVSPFPMYDVRIAPLVINTYLNNYGQEFNGDQVEIALYIPVTVKPYILLTEEEIKLRAKILGVKPKYVTSNIFPKRKMIMRKDSLVRPMYVIRHAKKDSILEPSSYNYPILYENFGSPIYASNGYTSCLIGWMIGRKFRKIKPKEYAQFGVPLYGRELLENEKQLDKTLRIKFGEYYQGVIN